MFSYRHAFHAGNHGDVLKHIILISSLRHLMQKPAPITIIDTHAGAGIYRLDDGAAQITGEALEGVLKLKHLIDDKNTPALLLDYLNIVKSFNDKNDWKYYAGSPFIIHHLMNEENRRAVHDRLKLFELHPTDINSLDEHIMQLPNSRHVNIEYKDGFTGLKALLPPPANNQGSRRAFVLIDPSYEIKTDYSKVATCIQDSLKRFATGVYMIWYPIIARQESHDLPRRLQTISRQANRQWLNVTLHTGAPAQTGLSASGVFIINPAHTLKQNLQESLDVIINELNTNERPAQYSIESS